MAVSVSSAVNKGKNTIHSASTERGRAFFEDYKEERSNLQRGSAERCPPTLLAECQPSRCSREICLSGLMIPRLPPAMKRYRYYDY